MLYYLYSNSLDPYYNLALEEALLDSEALRGHFVLYLWQNAKTVVIGRNQNAMAECDTNALDRDGGLLARRLSGGGAVYHDVGNLNYTFLYDKASENIDMQTTVIEKSLERFDLRAERTGRNDILLDGRKFSGNAYYSRGTRAYHHGTLLVNADMDALSKYLTVSKEKMQSKGVASARARVVNLCEFAPSITITTLRNALVEAFCECYQAKATLLPSDAVTPDADAIARYASYAWLYGRNIPYTWNAKKRFSWGEVDIRLACNRGKIEQCQIFSDAMCQDVMMKLQALLTGLEFRKDELTDALESIKYTEVYNDILQLLLYQ